MNGRLAAVAEEHELLLRVAASLTEEQLDAPSMAAGWRVRDVIAHLAASFSGMFGPGIITSLRSTDIERTNDDAVDARRDWPTARLLDELTTWQPRVLRVVPFVTRPRLGRIRVPVGELGKVELCLIPSGMLFECNTHLRCDIAPALGLDLPPASREALDGIIEWMMAIGTNLTPRFLPWLGNQRVVFAFGPPLHTAWTLRPDGTGAYVETRGADPRAAVTIVSPPEAFPMWATHRQSWRDAEVSLRGDAVMAERVADAWRVI